jgi:hypothetical protein
MTSTAEKLLASAYWRPLLEDAAKENSLTVEAAAETLAKELIRRYSMSSAERQARANIPASTLAEMNRVCGTGDLENIVREQRTSSVMQGPSMAGVSGQVVRTSVAPGLHSTAWSQSGNAGRW